MDATRQMHDPKQRTDKRGTEKSEFVCLYVDTALAKLCNALILEFKVLLSTQARSISSTL